MSLHKPSETNDESRLALGVELLSTGPRLQDLLSSGGDSRLARASDDRNSYGCTPFPRPSVMDFGSSTASNISERAFVAAQLAQDRMCLGAFRMSASAAMDAVVDNNRERLRAVLGASDAEIIFSPSGTDSQLQLLHLATMLMGRPLTTVIAGSDQTGSGTTYTARGHHFSDRTSAGRKVRKGGPIAGISEGIRSIEVPFFDDGGHLRTVLEMDRAVSAAVAEAAGRGEAVLLQAMDSSKLGWRAPSTACINHIAKAWPEQVIIAVDACQMRVGRARLKDYLARGYLVLLTGSKFFTGPAFSGALLVPHSRAVHIETLRPSIGALAGYTTRHDWPLRWENLRWSFPDQFNHGQWLRWEAALVEMEAYYAVPFAFRNQFFAKCAAAIPLLISSSPNLGLVATHVHTFDLELGEEMRHQSIFPFVARRNGEPLSLEHCAELYRAMGRDLSGSLPDAASEKSRRLASGLCEIGQPVALENSLGAALRICTSARQVSRHWRLSPSVEDAVQSVLANVRNVIGKVEWLIENPQLREGH